MYKVPLVFHRNYVSILYCFWDILCQIMAPLYRLHRSSYWHSTELRTYLVSFHCGPILYHFWDREILVKNRNFCHMTLCLVRPMPSRCVRLSVYRVCALYRNEYTYSQYGSPIILVFFRTKRYGNTPRALNTGQIWKKLQFFTNILLCLGKDTRQSHSYNDRSIKWCYFQWLDWPLRATTLFNVNKNGTRQGYTYNGSRIWYLKWCHIQWPWMTPNADCFKGNHYSTVNILETVQDRHSYNGIKTYSHPIQCTCNFE